MLIACATAASVFPFIGTVVYTILRPPEFLEDREERELELRAAELRLRQLIEQSCPHCEYPIERSYLRCPNCERDCAIPAASAASRSTRSGAAAPTARPRSGASSSERSAEREGAPPRPQRPARPRRGPTPASAPQRPAAPPIAMVAQRTPGGDPQRQAGELAARRAGRSSAAERAAHPPRAR